MKHSIRTITPELATQFVNVNVSNNRSLNKNRVALYANQMAAGKWRLNGEPLIFDKNGNLIQGQHRCHACIMANTSFTTAIVEGVDPEVFSTLDTGKPRNAFDVMSIDGVPNARLASAVVTLAIKYYRGELAYNRPIAPEEVKDFYRDNPEIAESVEAASKFGVEFPRSLIGFLDFFGKKVNYAATAKFIEDLRTGVGLTLDSPAKLLRERYTMKTPGKSYTKAYMIGVGIKALNAVLKGKTIQHLKFSDKETIQEIVGVLPTRPTV